ncbi:cysteinyl-tRNA synthetase [Desulfonatronum thiosulfatophilum]|uniref:Cysteine--tRNA ligase n=1 Tax=Desulfonatronum thiosulfatophilum TaxID=617002 RepID=A0A1G6C045_9BACT|nr:cysteine synthase [Desulfonatronum thiosulfatophilum]SDB26269.1 cysteinyl-tRNA synthetase [Desulfonatronum thiosulfatophilum]
MIHDHILSLIGHTPLVALGLLNPYAARVRIAAKLEDFNPGGSIKDRVALAMIEQAEASGTLTPEKVIIEATSGNTGIGLAMVCAVKGYKLKLLMPESASEERKRIMLAYGAEIHLTPGHQSTDGAIEEAYRLYRESPDRYVLMDQFNNPASIAAHYRTTAQEIWDQTEGRVTHVVATLGTSGTVMGLTKRLKELNPKICIVAVEPFAGHKIQGLKNMQESYPPGIYDKHAPDRILNVEDESAFDLCRKLAAQEGIFAGMSSGAALSGALQLARELDQQVDSEAEPPLVVTIFPDSGIRYLSTPLFAPPQEQGVQVRDLKQRGMVSLRSGKAGLRFFTPGPSLDQWADISAWRRIVLLDVLARFQRQKDNQAEVLVAIADLDDRAVAAARAEGKSLDESGREILAGIRELAGLLGVSDAVQFISAGRDVPGLMSACRKLLSKGLGYEKLRSVYFDVLRDKNYGSLLGVDPEKLRAGMTVDLDGYVKDNPRDFTLLKRTSLAELKDGYFLQTEWGNVRPSWYLQMAGAVLQGSSPELTLVLGDEDHKFPHLENLSSIWRGAANFQPQAWITAQSSICAEPAQDSSLTHFLDKGSDALALRFWLLSGSYHSALQCSADNLAMWSRNQQRIQQTLVRLHALAETEAPSPAPVQNRSVGQNISQSIGQLLFNVKQSFTDCLENDLNLPAFWPTLFQCSRDINTAINQSRLDSGEASACMDLFRHLDEVLGLLDWAIIPCRQKEIPEHVRTLCTLRADARRQKNYAEADRLRREIETAGYRIQDTADEPLIFRR